jgi:Fe-S cluster biogenesis protein NfuA
MIETIEKALQPIRNSLQADGFDLKVESFDEGIVSVVVLTGPEACIECLIPQEHLKLRIEDRLKGLARVVRLRYPEYSEPSH